MQTDSTFITYCDLEFLVNLRLKIGMNSSAAFRAQETSDDREQPKTGLVYNC